MDKQEVREKISALVKAKAEGISTVNLEDNLRNALGLDSIDIFELMLKCENLYDIALGESADEVNTVQDLTDLVCAKLKVN